MKINNYLRTTALATACLSLIPSLSFAGTSNQSPEVSIVAPTSSVYGVMKIVVEASDSDGIDRVKLYADNVQFGGDRTAPYTVSWDSISYAGSEVKIKAIAIDKSGAQSSDEIILAVADDEGSNPDTESPPASPKGNAKLLFTSDFETGGLQSPGNSHDGWSLQDGGIADAALVQKDVVRAGKYAVRSYLEKADWDGTNRVQGTIKPRTQLMKSNKYVPIEFDNEYWIGVSSFIPKDWDNETNVKNVEVLWQLHASGELGKNSPPLVLHVKNDQMYIVSHTGDLSKGMESRELWRGDIKKGAWVDWVIRVNISLEKGYVQIWKNGTKIADFSGGPTMYYDGKNKPRSPLYYTMGIYKPKYASQLSTVKSHTIYWDELRIAKGTNGTAVVSP